MPKVGGKKFPYTAAGKAAAKKAAAKKPASKNSGAANDSKVMQQRGVGMATAKYESKPKSKTTKSRRYMIVKPKRKSSSAYPGRGSYGGTYPGPGGKGGQYPTAKKGD